MARNAAIDRNGRKPAMNRRQLLRNLKVIVAATGSAPALTGLAALAEPVARHPKGEPVVRRFNEQRWTLDNIIQANGIDWDQGRTNTLLRACGIEVVNDIAVLRQRVRKLADIAPAFEALARRRE